eukprot:2839906-Rhodomonas_salina.5
MPGTDSENRRTCERVDGVEGPELDWRPACGAVTNGRVCARASRWYTEQKAHGHSPWTIGEHGAEPPLRGQQTPCMSCKFDLFSDRRALLCIGGLPWLAVAAAAVVVVAGVAVAAAAAVVAVAVAVVVVVVGGGGVARADEWCVFGGHDAGVHGEAAGIAGGTAGVYTLIVPMLPFMVSMLPLWCQC